MAELLVLVALMASLALLCVSFLKLSKKIMRLTLIGGVVLLVSSVSLLFYEMM